MQKAHVTVFPLGAFVFVLFLLWGVFPSMAHALNLTINFGGSGTGRVEVSSPGTETLNIFSSNTLDYEQHSSVTLTAIPTALGASTSTFDGWTGCASTSGNQCTVVMSANQTVSVVFNPATPNVAPAVNAGPSQTITLPSPATLTGTVTDDGLPVAPGAVTSTWSKVSGPGTVTFANASATSTTASFSEAGTYGLRLTANDGALTASANVTITVNAASIPNQPPSVSAGPSMTVALPNTAALMGTVKDDGLPATPGSVTSMWRKVTGPGTVTFDNASSPSTTASFSEAGTYVLRLTATDGALSQSSDVTITANNAGVRRLSNDLDADGTGDLLWRNSLNGVVVAWLMKDAAVASTGVLGGVASNWKIMGMGDVNADDHADVMWRNMTTGAVAVWFMDGLTRMSTGFPGNAPLSYVIKGIGDMDGNGTADLMWHNTVSGATAIWLLNGATRTSSGFPGNVPVQWEIAGLGDLNADEKADVIWRNTTTGAVAVWLMNGLTRTSTGFPGSAPLSYVIKEIGDVDGNGTADLVWHNTLNGAVVIWIMNGTKLAFAGFPGGVPLEWQMTGMGDVNADGHDDLIWQNKANGAVALWIMKGKEVMDTKFTRGTSTDWEIQ